MRNTLLNKCFDHFFLPQSLCLFHIVNFVLSHVQQSFGFLLSWGHFSKWSFLDNLSLFQWIKVLFSFIEGIPLWNFNKKLAAFFVFAQGLAHQDWWNTYVHTYLSTQQLLKLPPIFSPWQESLIQDIMCILNFRCYLELNCF